MAEVTFTQLNKKTPKDCHFGKCVIGFENIITCCCWHLLSCKIVYTWLRVVVIEISAKKTSFQSLLQKDLFFHISKKDLFFHIC